MTLYNLKTDGDQYRITKFTNDLDVESSYLLSLSECECPAGNRPSCRHRLMLPDMLAYDMANTNMFYDFETKVVLQSTVDECPEVEAEPLTAEDIEALPDGLEKDYQQEMQEPCGFAPQPHSTTASASDFDSEDGGSNPPEVATFLEGMSRTLHTTINYMEDGSVQIIDHTKPHPSIGPIKRRI